MMFGGGGLSSVGLGSISQDPGAIIDPTSLRPILTEINGIDARDRIQPDSIQIDDTLGQPVSASFIMVNPGSIPIVGDTIRILFYSHVIFAGTIDRVEKSTDDLAAFHYRCDCLDWSQVLIRRQLRRNFTNLPVQNILDSILDNELAEESLTIGTIDSRSSLPLVDAENARVFDVCREMAGATGQTFYVDYDKSIQMRSTSVEAAPLVLDEDHVEVQGTRVQTDREAYRNVQIVVVTGTPPDKNTDAMTVIVERTNDDQIAARQAIEGGSGRYEEIEEVTHPISNDGVELALLGIGYARLRLATSGTTRQTVRGQVRGYGFRAGQLASVNLPTFGIVGTFVIQKVSIQEQAAQYLLHQLELTSSSLQQRAYEAWLSVVKKGKVTIQLPGSLTNNLETFNTPGGYTWTVPAGVTSVEVTCIGASGGGGGQRNTNLATPTNGGKGGDSGKAVTILSVSPGEILSLTIGAAGLAGSAGYAHLGIVATDGTDGGLSSVARASLIVCQGNGGTKGIHATSAGNGADGTPGSGIGDAISTGGGKVGGAGGIGQKGGDGTNAGPGSDGLVKIRW
ncbi:MAG TPA: hypothetical protein VKP13_17430 [Nitrospira sp.]|nr:hypothetical protein [Nitrospira sp.]